VNSNKQPSAMMLRICHCDVAQFKELLVYRLGYQHGQLTSRYLRKVMWATHCELPRQDQILRGKNALSFTGSWFTHDSKWFLTSLVSISKPLLFMEVMICRTAKKLIPCSNCMACSWIVSYSTTNLDKHILNFHNKRILSQIISELIENIPYPFFCSAAWNNYLSKSVYRCSTFQSIFYILCFCFTLRPVLHERFWSFK
jgi:hypothetical protein